MSRLKKISHCFGKGDPMFFAIDSESKAKERKIIMHFVQFSTIVLDADEHERDNKTYKSLHLDNDPRLAVLADCIHK